MSFLNPQREGSDRGASMIEYALLVSLISVVAFAGVSMVGHRTEDKFDVIAQGLDGRVVTATDHIDEDLTEDDAGTPPEEEASDPEPDPGDSGGSSGSVDDSGGSEGAGGSGGPTDDGDEPTVEVELDGSETTITSASSEITDWKENKKGGKGEWAATFDFLNDWTADQVLVVEVTWTDEKGKTKTENVKVSVPAGGAASLEIGENSLTSKNGKISGVVALEIKVVSIATSNPDGSPVSYDGNGQSATTVAPATP